MFALVIITASRQNPESGLKQIKVMETGTQIRELTKAELEIMQILWDRDGAFVNEVVAEMPEPKPAYNTVSTIIRILEKKGFVDHEPFGRTFRYYPVVGREEYTQTFMSNVLDRFFGNSVTQMISFFAEKEKISAKEMDEIMTILSEKK